MASIERETTVEELIESHPASVRILLRRGIQCLVCGEPIWGTVEDLARGAGLSDAGIEELILELNVGMEKQTA